MPLKYSVDIRKLCSPFIYEKSALCDYEIITDELCATLGSVISELEENERFTDIFAFLDELQPKIFHLNGSIRGRQAVFDEQLEWLAGYFILPRGIRDISRALGVSKTTVINTLKCKEALLHQVNPKNQTIGLDESSSVHC